MPKRWINNNEIEKKEMKLIRIDTKIQRCARIPAELLDIDGYLLKEK